MRPATPPGCTSVAANGRILFSLEIYGRDAKLHWEGLGGSYGMERLTYYKMLPQMGPPETTIWEYPRGDESWKIEMTEFFEDIRAQAHAGAGIEGSQGGLGGGGKNLWQFGAAVSNEGASLASGAHSFNGRAEDGGPD